MNLSIQRMLNKIKKVTFGIHKKIFFFNALSSIILSISISIIVINIVGNSMREQIYINMKNFTQQLSNTIDAHIFEMQNILIRLSQDNNVKSFMYNDYDGEYEKLQSYRELYKYLNTAILKTYS